VIGVLISMGRWPRFGAACGIHRFPPSTGGRHEHRGVGAAARLQRRRRLHVALRRDTRIRVEERSRPG